MDSGQLRKLLNTARQKGTTMDIYDYFDKAYELKKQGYKPPEDTEISPELYEAGQEADTIAKQWLAMKHQYDEQERLFQEMIKQRRESEEDSPEYTEAHKWLLDKKRQKEENKFRMEYLKATNLLDTALYKMWFQAAYDVCGEDLFSNMNKREIAKVKKLIRTKLI